MKLSTLGKLLIMLNLLFGGIIYAQLITFDLIKNGATGCANFMNYIQPDNVTPVFAFDTFFWDETSASTATEENLSVVTGTAGLSYESTTFTLTYYKHINVVNPNGDPLQSGERGDYRIYGGGTIRIFENDVIKLTLTNCITTNKVSWPANLDGPEDDVTVQGSGWGTIDTDNSNPDWLDEFDANGTGQIFIEYSSISPVVQNSCGSISRYNFTVSFYSSNFTRSIVSETVDPLAIVNGGKEIHNKITAVVDMEEINLSFDFSSAESGGQNNDKNDLYAEFRSDVAGGDLPEGINAIGSAGYWDIGTTLESFTTEITFDLSTYPGINNINDIVMLRRETEGADWEEYPTQSVYGNTIVCTDVTSFSQWAPGSKGGDPLPVELTSFTGELIDDSIVLLKWETATEVNNYGFQVQRTKEKVQSENQWEEIGFVQGHGTTNSPKSYSFTDPLNLDLNPNLTRLDYRLKQIDNDGTFAYSKIVTVDLTTITSVDDEVIYEFALEQNYPNPFNPTTTIKFTIPGVGDENFRPLRTHLIVYDILGREVAVLVNQKLQPGNHEVKFDASNLSSGVYFYRIQISSGYSGTKKLVLLK